MPTDPLSQVFAALADPTRRAILARLSEGEASVNELASPFDVTLPAISKHLKVLEKAGLIERTRTAQWRPCRLQAAPLKTAVDWMEQYRQYWEESFDRLGEYLKTVTAAANANAPIKSNTKAKTKAKTKANATANAKASPSTSTTPSSTVKRPHGRSHGPQK